jgi:hypothetical protein
MRKFASLSKYTHPFDQQAMTMNPKKKKKHEKKYKKGFELVERERENKTQPKSK